MEQIRAITVNETTYNVAQASAMQQKKLTLLIGGKVAINSAMSNADKIDTPLLVGALMTMPEQTFDEIASIVLSKAFLAGSNTAVTIDSFQGSIMSYMLLVAEALAFNLADFFTWLDSANAARRVQAKASKD